jgi:hypothetical protein
LGVVFFLGGLFGAIILHSIRVKVGSICDGVSMVPRVCKVLQYNVLKTLKTIFIKNYGERNAVKER